MSKKSKEIEAKIKNYKTEYIYHRNNGVIHKFEKIDDNVFIDVNTGLTIDLTTHFLLGKTSENIVDLIEIGDYVNLERVLDITGEYIRTTERIHNTVWLSNNIKSIVTHEQFKSVEFKV